MQLNKMKQSVALLCAAALTGAALVVRADCGNTGPSGNDAEVACHNCADDSWSTGSCTWHEAESGDAYCGVCQNGYNCGAAGTRPEGDHLHEWDVHLCRLHRWRPAG